METTLLGDSSLLLFESYVLIIHLASVLANGLYILLGGGKMGCRSAATGGKGIGRQGQCKKLIQVLSWLLPVGSKEKMNHQLRSVTAFPR